MATQLHQILAFLNVPNGGTATLPHNVNINGFGVLPDRVFFDSGGFAVNAISTSSLTVQNNSGALASVNVWLEHFHTIERDFGAAQVLALSPQPFIVSGGGSGGLTGNQQVFRYIATGAEGSDFFVTLPAARASDVYRVVALLSGVALIVGLDCPDILAGDRTTTQFRVVSTASVSAGDQIDFLASDPLT